MAQRLIMFALGLVVLALIVGGWTAWVWLVRFVAQCP